MAHIGVDEGVCTGCGVCESACLFDAIDFDGALPHFTETCTLCGACVTACPVKAIAIHRRERNVDLSAYRGVWAFIEFDEENIRSASIQVLSEARRLAEKVRESCAAVVVGSGKIDLQDILASHGANEVYLLEGSEGLNAYNTELYTHAISRLITQYRPSIFLFSATYLGRDLAPRIAARIGTGLTADCTELDIDGEGNLLQVRPTYGGDILASILCPSDRPQMATVRPNVIKAEVFDRASDSIEVRRLSVDIPEKSVHATVLREVKEIAKFANLEDSDIIISGGKGLGAAKNFKILEDLAETLGLLMNGSQTVSVGASRSAVDAGWMPHQQQVGQTGKVVTPKLYIACGISGAIQHLMGMRNAERVIAINKDRGAPIFKLADVGIIGDLFEVVPRITNLLKEQS